MVNSVEGVLQSKYGDQVRMMAWYAEKEAKELLVNLPFQSQYEYDRFTNFFKILDKFIFIADVVYANSDINCPRFAGRLVCMNCIDNVVRLLNQKYHELHAEYNTPIINGELNLIKTIAKSINTIFSEDSNAADIDSAFYDIANGIAVTAMCWSGGFNWRMDEVIDDLVHINDKNDEDNEEELDDDIVEKIFSTDHNRKLFAKYASDFEYNRYNEKNDE